MAPTSHSGSDQNTTFCEAFRNSQPAGAGDSIKPGVKRSETPGRVCQKECRAREACGSPHGPMILPLQTQTAFARFAGSGFLLSRILGFRFASPQASRCRPLRGLKHLIHYPRGARSGKAGARTFPDAGQLVNHSLDQWLCNVLRIVEGEIGKPVACS